MENEEAGFWLLAPRAPSICVSESFAQQERAILRLEHLCSRQGQARSPSGLVEFEPVKGPGITEGEKGR